MKTQALNDKTLKDQMGQLDKAALATRLAAV
ncbi:MAG: hypothetical protein RLZZ597_1111 [Cyanobacteriota bacterium]|jgi:hypothetical protein